jgi:hypothetical protein
VSGNTIAELMAEQRLGPAADAAGSKKARFMPKAIFQSIRPRHSGRIRRTMLTSCYLCPRWRIASNFRRRGIERCHLFAVAGTRRQSGGFTYRHQPGQGQQVCTGYRSEGDVPGFRLENIFDRARVVGVRKDVR